MSIENNRPSIVFGVSGALKLWPLVAVVWFMSVALVAPISVIFHGVAVDALGHVPTGLDLPNGEGAILAFSAIREAAGTLIIGLLFAVVLSWFWAVLWHAGVARLMVWDPEGPNGVSRILGMGLGVWWKYCRLSLVAIFALVALLVSVWLPLSIGVNSAHEAMAEDRMVLMIGVGIVLSAIVKLLVWGATLRGCWLLARPDARSPVMSWLRGIAGVFRQPVSTFGPMLALGLSQALLVSMPVILPMFYSALRGTPMGTIVAAASTLAASFLTVALYLAFAPVSGMVFRSGDDDEE